MDSSLSPEQIHELALTIWNMPHRVCFCRRGRESDRDGLMLNDTAKL